MQKWLPTEIRKNANLNRTRKLTKRPLCIKNTSLFQGSHAFFGRPRFRFVPLLSCNALVLVVLRFFRGCSVSSTSLSIKEFSESSASNYNFRFIALYLSPFSFPFSYRRFTTSKASAEFIWDKAKSQRAEKRRIFVVVLLRRGGGTTSNLDFDFFTFFPSLYLMF